MDQRRYLQVALDTMNILKAVEVTTERYVKMWRYWQQCNVL